MQQDRSQLGSEPPASAPAPPRSRKRSRTVRWSGRIAVVVLALLGVAELVGRFAFGLGNPPLFRGDPEIEYLYRPNQDIHRFGSHLHFNAYSMRSDDFPSHKSDPRELRVMVIG